MAKGRNTFTWNSRDAKRIMESKAVQRKLREAAERGVRAFRQAAPKDSGRFARNVRIEPARGWDGRPGLRIVAYKDSATDNSPISIEFGTSDTPPANAMQAAMNAIERGLR